jgi:parvulin-like peptidyl-prolyl isomerase
MRFSLPTIPTLSGRLIILGSFGVIFGHAALVCAQDEALSPKSQGNRVQATPASSVKNVPQADVGPAVVATVNGQPISLGELAQQCIARHGEELLENMVNRTLLLQACQARKIEVTKKDVDDEIARTASKFGLTVPMFLKLLQEERNIAPEHYATDIVWHMLSLRALSKEAIMVSPQELDHAFQREFGPKVQVRMIACKDMQKLTQLHQQAVADPDMFKTLARDHSEDPASASVEGLLPPIRKNMGDDDIEKVSFKLQPGEISNIFQIGEFYITLQCVRHFPPANPPAAQLTEIQNRIRSDIEEEKLRKSAEQTYVSLRDNAQVISVLGKPELQQQYPGVAAVINGQALMMTVLEKECVKRFGPAVLDNEINMKLVEQALAADKLQVTQADIDSEIRYTAEFYGYVQSDGTPDIQRWIADVLSDEGKTVDMYIRDVIQPTVALKKLVANRVQVTEEDIQKGFEANFGTRAEVLAIVLSNQRTAQEVWEMARNRPTEQFFGELANQYSVEPSSRSNFGKVPPLRPHSGQPTLEKAAFGMKPGEMSAIIEVGGQYVILRCQGFTDPVVTDINAVRGELLSEIREKKTRLEMDNAMSKLQADAQITNFLAPKKSRLGAVEKQATINEFKNSK